MGTHMPYGITQCYLPPSRGDIPAMFRDTLLDDRKTRIFQWFPHVLLIRLRKWCPFWCNKKAKNRCFVIHDLKNRLLTTNGRVPTVLPKPNFPTFPVNHTTFPDLYRHTFHYRKHTIICNTSTNYLGMQILPSKRFCTRTFNCFYIHRLHLPLKVGQNKISTIRSITGTFSTQLCAIPNLPPTLLSR